MRFSARYSIYLLVVIAMLLGLPAFGARASKTVVVTYDHGTQVLSPASRIPLARGDTLELQITDTFDNCYNFPTKIIQPPALERNPDEKTTTIPLTWKHDGRAAGYEFSIKYRPNLTPERLEFCKQRDQVDNVRIEVENLSWSLGFAGGFTVDRLTDPVYFLQPTTQKVNGTDTAGFNVQKNSSAKDAAVLGTAAMIHLYHTDPERYPFLGGNWTPVTFGMGVGADSKTKYYFGTSLRYDEHLYLTGGVVFGPIKRLPNNLDTNANKFTTNAMALDNMPTRNKSALFFSVSYTFLGRNLQGNNGPFVSAFAAAGSGSGSGGQQQQQGGNDEKIQLDAKSAKPGASLKITPKSGDFGANTVSKSSAKVGETVFNAADLGDKWKASEINVTVPASTAPGDVNVTVTKAGTVFGTAKLKIEAVLKVDPVSGKAGDKITIKPPVGLDFGGTAEGSSVKFGDKEPIKSTAIVDKWTKDAIKDLPLPAGVPTGKITITVVKEGQTVGSVDFDVKP